MRRYRGKQQVRNRPFGQIPFGSVITQLCVRAGVRWGAEEEMQRPMVDIDSAVIARLGDWPGGRPHPRGVGFIVPGAEGAAPPVQRQRQARAGRVSSSRGPGMEFMESQFRRMFRRMDAMHNANRQFAEELTSSLDSVLARDGQEVQWPVYGASHPYPPPDSPPTEEGGDADDQ
ncbi:hypothetical protein POM88_007125 [Heracleum sosnowskyi]|uniref:Uncharacterized protein n=2 Tax=Heracleum sosnowskyi TaxID=360622 RepID=A0AAD8IRH8_9APIA|nr:hypothetical protein POM88_016883 [Heracleum sosnowskyi]KAK1397262.1 hypothetical protein POM88_007125 [Heracleum sosnowskyi]